MTRRVRNMPKITSIEQLKRETLALDADFAILLNYGVYSRKSIEYDGYSELFSLFNHIDDTEEEMTEAELKESFIGEAIRKGAFIKLDDYEGGLRDFKRLEED